MSAGAIVRKIAGPLERKLCAAYRAVFINVHRCTEQIVQAIPENAYLIDVGGGDGEPLNYLLRMRPDVTVAMLDLRAQMGMFLDPDVRERVTLHPSTSLAAYRAQAGRRADALLVSDVMHHVPSQGRAEFIRDCLALLKPNGVLIVKDVAPGGLISHLGVLADRYITGDRHVALMEPSELVALVEGSGDLRMSGVLLDRREHPNFAIAFQGPADRLA